MLSVLRLPSSHTLPDSGSLENIQSTAIVYLLTYLSKMGSFLCRPDLALTLSAQVILLLHFPK